MSQNKISYRTILIINVELKDAGYIFKFVIGVGACTARRRLITNEGNSESDY